MSAVGTGTSSGAAAATAAVSKRGRVSTASATPLAVETLISVGSPQDVAEPLRPGRNFSFQLTFTNPLYEAIEVILEQLEPASEDMNDDDRITSTVNPGEDPTQERKGPKQPWAITLPGPVFGIDAFAEDWEYEAAEDEDDDLDSFSSSASSKKRKYGPGILAKKANKTVVQMDLTVGREAVGEIRVPLYVTYTYTAEEAIAPGSTAVTPTKDKRLPVAKQVDDTSKLEVGDVAESSNLKSFSFWASIPLGRVVPRAGALTGTGSLMA